MKNLLCFLSLSVIYCLSSLYQSAVGSGNFETSGLTQCLAQQHSYNQYPKMQHVDKVHSNVLGYKHKTSESEYFYVINGE